MIERLSGYLNKYIKDERRNILVDLNKHKIFDQQIYRYQKPHK